MAYELKRLDLSAEIGGRACLNLPGYHRYGKKSRATASRSLSGNGRSYISIEGELR